MKTLFYIGWLSFFSIFLTISCTKQMQEEDSPFLVPATRLTGAEQGTTYRIAAYQENGRFVSSGSYVFLNPDDETLTPCMLDVTGRFLSIDPQAALNLEADGDYYLVCLSPGVALDSGGLLHFIPGNLSLPLKMSPAEKHRAGEFGVIRMQGPMTGLSAELTFDFYHAPSASSLQITGNSIGVAGVPPENTGVIYDPFSRNVSVSSGEPPLNLPLSSPQESVTVAGKALCYRSETVCVVSGKYGSPLRLVFEMQLDGDKVKVDLPLTGDPLPELQPQHHYRFNVFINDEDIAVTVSIRRDAGSDWEKGGSGGVEISEPGTVTVRIGWWQMLRDYLWKVVHPGDQTIN